MNQADTLFGVTMQEKGVSKIISVKLAEVESMGAGIQINGKTAVVTGQEKLFGATVCAHDLRAGAALVIAGLAAEGVTRVENIHFVERGYEDIIGKLTNLGAQIRREED